MTCNGPQQYFTDNSHCNGIR
uniref:BMA-PBS-1, isoform f n=1 Tax=Brugia malayi TaxID=6279 RepID=A0A1I9G2F4_BRUMA|nr:BMA-PBS-1, isoform f [Brugia malayi]